MFREDEFIVNYGVYVCLSIVELLVCTLMFSVFDAVV